MVTHTPGPWEACDPELWGDGMEDVLVAAADPAGEEGNLDNEVAAVRGQDAAAVRDANVRLIIAAPDLLVACEAVLAWAEPFLVAGANKDRSSNRRAAFLAAAAHVRMLVKDAVAKAKTGTAESGDSIPNIFEGM